MFFCKKISTVSLCALVGLTSSRPEIDNPRQSLKRYSDLMNIVVHYNGADFDEKKMWSYGCHCIILGDRPMSEMGQGAPVDEMDSICRKYKNCQKCTRLQHGAECIGEFVEYKYKIQKSGNLVARDDEGTCERNLFECDRQFALDLAKTSHVYDDKYNRFYGDFDNSDPDNCVVHAGGEYEPECCGGDDRPFILFNTKGKLKCCEDGSVGLSC